MRIAVITFSRRAAQELRERFGAAGVTVGYCGTMHALAWKLIRQSEAYAQRPVRINRHAGELQSSLIRKLFPGYAHIPDKILTGKGFLSESERGLLNEHYQNLLRESDQTDFDGLILNATRLNLGADKFDVVFVDEFQDTSPDQVEFIHSLTPQKLFVVGDDWQSIYRFRGADVSITQSFPRHFPGARRAYLKKNYRSGRAIVRLGNRVIRESSTYVRKRLKAEQKTSHRTQLFLSAKDDVAAIWQDFLAARGRHPLANEKWTVLVRTNAMRLLLEKIAPPELEIMTIHKSKGLEFDHVAVFGVARHVMPHRENDRDEEVRILYVALTRARKYLCFVGWGNDIHSSSEFLPLLTRKCQVKYI